jgi:hypothetical protein
MFSGLSYLSTIPELVGPNFKVWRNQLDCVLTMLDLDYVLSSSCPQVLKDVVRGVNESEESFQTRSTPTAKVVSPPHADTPWCLDRPYATAETVIRRIDADVQTLQACSALPSRPRAWPGYDEPPTARMAPLAGLAEHPASQRAFHCRHRRPHDPNRPESVRSVLCSTLMDEEKRITTFSWFPM